MKVRQESQTANLTPHLYELYCKIKLGTSRFKDFEPQEKYQMIDQMMREGMSGQQISEELNITRQFVQYYKRNIAKGYMRCLDPARIDEVIGGLIWAKEMAEELALKQGDVGTFWKVNKELVDSLMDLGHLKRAALKIEGKIDLASTLEAMADSDPDIKKSILDLDDILKRRGVNLATRTADSIKNN